MTNLATSILDQATTEAERPRPLPVGTYICSVLPDVQKGTSSNKGTEYIQYRFQVLDLFRDKEGNSDVSEDELEELGGIGSLRPITVTVYLTENSAWRHRKLLDDLGTPEKEGRKNLSHWERAQMAPGHQVVANFRHEPNQDGSAVFPRLNYTASVE